MTLQELFARPNSWCQHALFKTRFVPETGRRVKQCCLEGAVIECYGEVNIRQSVVKQKLYDAIGELGGNSYSLPAYNDADRRTIEDIRALVKAANV